MSQRVTLVVTGESPRDGYDAAAVLEDQGFDVQSVTPILRDLDVPTAGEGVREMPEDLDYDDVLEAFSIVRELAAQEESFVRSDQCPGSIEHLFYRSRKWSEWARDPEPVER